jgi:hypothetical protein
MQSAAKLLLHKRWPAGTQAHHPHSQTIRSNASAYRHSLFARGHGDEAAALAQVGATRHSMQVVPQSESVILLRKQARRSNMLQHKETIQIAAMHSPPSPVRALTW